MWSILLENHWTPSCCIGHLIILKNTNLYKINSLNLHIGKGMPKSKELILCDHISFLFIKLIVPALYD